MEIKVSNITDESQWAGLLSQSPYSWHGHSMEYQKIIQMNDPRHQSWLNLLFIIEDEQYLFPCELLNNKCLSHDKYYAGLIPLTTIKHINWALMGIKNIAKQSGANSLMLSYLETDDIFGVMKLNVTKLCYNGNWLNASIMKVGNYEEVWNKVYDAKARNLVRKAQKSLEFKIINILDYAQDAVDCTLSKAVRHNSMMPDYYRDVGLFTARQKKIADIIGEQAISFGAFFEGKLIAYINTIRSYHEAIISNLLSNADYWKYAPNNGLFDFMIKYYCGDEGIQQLMYSFDGVKGVDQFKHSIGFIGIPVARLVFGI